MLVYQHELILHKIRKILKFIETVRMDCVKNDMKEKGVNDRRNS